MMGWKLSGFGHEELWCNSNSRQQPGMETLKRPTRPFDRKKPLTGGPAPSAAGGQSLSLSDLRSDPNSIPVFDEFRREVIFTRRVANKNTTQDSKGKLEESRSTLWNRRRSLAGRRPERRSGGRRTSLSLR